MADIADRARALEERIRNSNIAAMREINRNLNPTDTCKDCGEYVGKQRAKNHLWRCIDCQIIFERNQTN